MTPCPEPEEVEEIEGKGQTVLEPSVYQFTHISLGHQLDIDLSLYLWLLMMAVVLLNK